MKKLSPENNPNKVGATVHNIKPNVNKILKLSKNLTPNVPIIKPKLKCEHHSQKRESELDEQFDLTRQNFENFHIERAKRQSLQISRELKLPKAQPHQLIKNEPQNYHAQRVPYVTFLKSLESKDVEIFIVSANKTATEVKSMYKVKNNQCFLNDNSFAQEAILCDHLTKYNKCSFMI